MRQPQAEAEAAIKAKAESSLTLVASRRGRQTQTVLRRAAVFITVSCCTYFLLVFVAIAVVLAEGGGLSCDRNCSPTQQFLNDSGIIRTVVAVGVSLGVGWWASGRPWSRRGKTVLVLATSFVLAVLLAEAVG